MGQAEVQDAPERVPGLERLGALAWDVDSLEEASEGRGTLAELLPSAVRVRGRAGSRAFSDASLSDPPPSWEAAMDRWRDRPRVTGSGSQRDCKPRSCNSQSGGLPRPHSPFWIRDREGSAGDRSPLAA